MRSWRKKGDEVGDDQAEELDDLEELPDPGRGPYDHDAVETGDDYVDLGSLLVRPFEGTELRMQVDEETGAVLAVLLMTESGALELRAFAAPREGDLWSDVRREIGADTARRGGTTDERQGPFGPELYCELPVTLDDGTAATQPSRIIGHNGARWFLRATLLGQPAVEPENAEVWEEAIAAVVVRRGADAMPPGEALPLELPAEARRVE